MDTFLGTIAGINYDHAEALLASGKYHTRASNKVEMFVPEIDGELVRKVYKIRDRSTLFYSGMTNMVGVLRESVTTAVTGEQTKPGNTKVHLVINTWPYDLSADEIKEQEIVISGHTCASKVTSIYRSPEDLTPDYISEFDAFTWHELDGWLSMHLDALKTGVMKEVNCYFPVIAVVDEEEAEEMHDGYIAHHVTHALGQYFVYNGMPLHYFSLFMPTEHNDQAQ